MWKYFPRKKIFFDVWLRSWKCYGKSTMTDNKWWWRPVAVYGGGIGQQLGYNWWPRTLVGGGGCMADSGGGDWVGNSKDRRLVDEFWVKQKIVYRIEKRKPISAINFIIYRPARKKNLVDQHFRGSSQIPVNVENIFYFLVTSR